VVSDIDRIDLTNPLSNRFIRFWPYPFGQQQTEIPVVSVIEESDIGQQYRTAAVEEEKRLLYVSLTRARDLLIIPLPENKTSGPWMGTLNADWMLPDRNKLKIPDNTEILSASREFDASETAAAMAPEKYTPYWFEPRSPASEKLPATLNPSSFKEVAGVDISEALNTGMQLEIKGSPPRNQVGLALHQLITAEIINPGHKDTQLTAERILKSYEIAKYIDSKAAVTYAQHFIDFINKTFQPKTILTEYPVTQVLDNGQVINGWIDVLIETDSGWVIVDHKFTARAETELENEALKYSGQILAYKQAVEAATIQKNESCWIHFPLAGILFKLEI